MIGAEEDQKEQKELKKMKSLLDILANKLPPKIPVNLSLLQKCEAVLQKILSSQSQSQSNQPKPSSFPTIARPPSVPLKVRPPTVGVSPFVRFCTSSPALDMF